MNSHTKGSPIPSHWHHVYANDLDAILPPAQVILHHNQTSVTHSIQKVKLHPEQKKLQQSNANFRVRNLHTRTPQTSKKSRISRTSCSKGIFLTGIKARNSTWEKYHNYSSWFVSSSLLELNYFITCGGDILLYKLPIFLQKIAVLITEFVRHPWQSGIESLTWSRRSTTDSRQRHFKFSAIQKISCRITGGDDGHTFWCIIHSLTWYFIATEWIAMFGHRERTQ